MLSDSRSLCRCLVVWPAALQFGCGLLWVFARQADFE